MVLCGGFTFSLGGRLQGQRGQGVCDIWDKMLLMQPFLVWWPGRHGQAKRKVHIGLLMIVQYAHFYLYINDMQVSSGQMSFRFFLEMVSWMTFLQPTQWGKTGWWLDRSDVRCELHILQCYNLPLTLRCFLQVCILHLSTLSTHPNSLTLHCCHIQDKIWMWLFHCGYSCSSSLLRDQQWKQTKLAQG